MFDKPYHSFQYRIARSRERARIETLADWLRANTPNVSPAHVSGRGLKQTIGSGAVDRPLYRPLT